MLFLAVVLDMSLLDLAQLHVLGMEYGYQIPGCCGVKVLETVMHDCTILTVSIMLYNDYIIAIDCGRPSVNKNVNATYNSTLFNAKLMLSCADNLLSSGIPTAQCYLNGSWTPNPTDYVCNNNMSEGAEQRYIG